MKDIDKAKMIRDQIATKIERRYEYGLIQWADNDYDIGTLPNALFGILQAVLCEVGEARAIRNGIKDRIGFTEGFVNPMMNPPTIIEDSRRAYTIGPMPAHNAAFGLLELILGQRYEAEAIRNKLKTMPFNKDSLIGKSISDYNDMYHEREISTVYAISSTNLFRLLNYGLDKEKAPDILKQPIPEEVNSYDCAGYIYYNIFKSIIEKKVDPEEIFSIIQKKGIIVSDGLIMEKGYGRSPGYSTIPNAALGILYASEELRRELTLAD